MAESLNHVFRRLPTRVLACRGRGRVRWASAIGSAGLDSGYHCPADRSRAQTSMDFVIGISIFLITVGVVFGMLPSIIDPFAESPDASMVTDRIASQIADGMLADPARPGTLNETCTFAFFEASFGDGKHCPVGFDETESDLATRLNVSSTYSVNVTIRRDIDGDETAETLCTDGDAAGACSGALGTPLAVGSSPPGHQSTFAASRTVYLDGRDATLVVEVW